MSQITIRCPGCKKGYVVPADKVGKRVKCKGCQREFVIEDPTPEPVELVSDPFGGGYADVAAIEPAPMAAPQAYSAPRYSAGNISSGTQTNGFAITSLVCGCALCVPLAGIAAIVFGILGIVRSNKLAGRGRGISIAGITLGGAGTVVLPMLVAIMLPALALAREQANRAKCANQMRLIGVAISEYASQTGGRIPPDLTTLVNYGVLSPANLICPDDKSAAVSGAKTSYTLLSPGAMLNAVPPQQPILDEPLSDHDVGANFLFPDGHVAWYEGTAAEAMIAAGYRTQQQNTIPSFAGPINLPHSVQIPQPIIPGRSSLRHRDPFAQFDRDQFVGTWKSPRAKIDGSITGPATVTFNPDFTFTFHADGPDGPVDFSGRWNIARSSIMMHVDKQTGSSISLMGWYIESVADDHLYLGAQHSPEQWTKQ